MILLALLGTDLAVAQDSSDAGWKWSLTPYVWATDISENLVLDGRTVGGGDTEFKDLVDLIDTSLQLRFEGMRERWGLFADLTYIELSDSAPGTMGLSTVDARIQETVLDAGAVYRPGGPAGRLDLLFGVRTLSADEDYVVRLGDREIARLRNDESYVDALLGARYTVPLAERWVLRMYGDVSLGDTDGTWTARALLGWLFGRQRQSSVFFGYGYRALDYQKADVLEVEKTLAGFGLGVKFGF